MILIAALLSLAAPADRRYEGDWYIEDTTDNVTGEREVYAMDLHFEAGQPEFVTLRIRCEKDLPILQIEWDRVDFPDQAVLTIAAASPDKDTAEARYMFEKSADPAFGGLKASPNVSQSVVAAIGRAKYATITAHLGSSNRSIGIPVNGMSDAWARVARHCPVRLMQVPPA